jgi:pimeloyl-ACP methyl ester carboxylesterase
MSDSGATQEPGAARTVARSAPPRFLAVLAGRFDRSAIDVPRDRARIRLAVEMIGSWDFLVDGSGSKLVPAPGELEPDALLTADAGTWQRIADDVRGGMDAFRQGRLRVRRNVHLGVGFLAATSGDTGPARLRFDSVRARGTRTSILAAGAGEPVVCVHGLGGTKASFLPTVSALADGYRVIALDLPGFGDSDKPLAAAYDAPYFARKVRDLLDALGIGRAHLVGNSMGGRVAIELGLIEPRRVGGIVLLSPALAWLRERRFKWLLPTIVPRLGLIQPTPRAIAEPIVRRLVPGGNDGWSAAGVDEFLRAYLDPRGRAAFYAAARNIYMDEPHGERGLWTRLAQMSPETMFVWGRRDGLVPPAFRKHVERVLPAARHVELDCGHVPQLERPRETHRAIREFLAAVGPLGRGPNPR